MLVYIPLAVLDDVTTCNIFRDLPGGHSLLPGQGVSLTLHHFLLLLSRHSAVILATSSSSLLSPGLELRESQSTGGILPGIIFVKVHVYLVTILTLKRSVKGLKHIL